MSNNLTDLNTHLFEQLNRVGKEDLSSDDLAREVQRSEAMVSIAGQVLKGAALSLEAAKLEQSVREDGIALKMPTMLERPKQ